jgi:hypothetical protein
VRTHTVVVPRQTFRAGQLVNFLPQWRLLTEDPVTLRVVAGYKLRFRSRPPLRRLLPHELKVRSGDEVVNEEVIKMLACGAVTEVDSTDEGFFSPIFAVDKLERGVVYGKRVIISKFFAVLYDSTLSRHWDISPSY